MKPIVHTKTTTFYRTLFVLPFLLLATASSWAQAVISGKVTDEKDKPLSGASVYLDNTLDGGTTDSTGAFKFTTTEKGDQTIVASSVGHSNGGAPIKVDGNVSGIKIKLKSNYHDLDEVTITAGSYEASDNNKTVLKPLDIVTTAGAQADVIKAIETLPGTQQTGTQNGLFVRGGDASEASILVDEMVVQNAFFSGAPGVATRSRFNAFQYQGVSFSSGGYSARYGQALSSVLELNTLDLPDKSNINLGLNMAGVYASGTKLWKNSSLDLGGSYNDLTPFYGIAATNFKFYDVPRNEGGNIRYAWKPNKNGILKIAANGTNTTSGIAVPNPYAYDTIPSDAKYKSLGDTVNYRTKEQNYYSNVSYKQMFGSKYSLYTAASYSYDQTNSDLGSVPIDEKDQRAQYRIEGKDYINSRLNLLLGGEVQNYSIQKSFDTFKQTFTETQAAGYLEAEWTPINWLAFRPGVRYEYSALLGRSDIAPRFSMAVKTGHYSQASFATGMFYQDPDNVYLLAGFHHLNFQEATHFILNWQYVKDDRTLRLEGYYKSYNDLIREHLSDSLFDPNAYRFVFSNEQVDNSGHGYAQGLELFWRDKKSVKNLDYWISYSYIDTRRLYKNYVAEATPDFIANHNLNLVTKYFVDKWHTNFSATYTFASGRPYYNRFNPTFLGDRTPDYNNLALTVVYLKSFGKWFTAMYASLDNITNAHNVFGYRYSNDGTQRYPMVPALYRSIFVGINVSLTQFSKDEL